MSTIGYRQKGDSGPHYNPERDLAYITPTLMARAVGNMECAYDNSEEIKTWCDSHSITKADMANVAEALALMQRDFINAADPVTSFEQAMQRRNFSDFPLPLRQYLFAAIGETICAAWFLAVREVSIIGEESPAQLNMARFAAVVNDFAARNNCGSYPVAALAENLKLRNDVLQTRLNVVYKELQDTKAKLAATGAGCLVDNKRQSIESESKPVLSRIANYLERFLGRTPACRSTGCTKTRSNSGQS
jgi:hypothetical protein